MKPDGSFRLNLDYFDYCTGLRMTNARFHELFGGPPRKAEEPLTQHHMDVAASIQAVTDEAVLRLTHAIAAETGLPNLCLAGGVALNCVVNGRVLRDAGSSGCGYSRPRGTRAGRWAPLCVAIISSRASRGLDLAPSTPWRAPISALPSPRRISSGA